MASPSFINGNGSTNLHPLSFNEVLVNFYMIMWSEWDTVIHLSKSQNMEDLDWLLSMFTSCDPCKESTCPFRQGGVITID